MADRVPCGPVQDAEEIMRDPHVHARQMVVELEHPGCRQPKAIAGTPIKLTVTPASERTWAPLLGEHTDEVLSLLGYDRSEIERLHALGVGASQRWLPEGRS